MTLPVHTQSTLGSVVPTRCAVWNIVFAWRAAPLCADERRLATGRNVQLQCIIMMLPAIGIKPGLKEGHRTVVLRILINLLLWPNLMGDTDVNRPPVKLSVLCRLSAGGDAR